MNNGSKGVIYKKYFFQYGGLIMKKRIFTSAVAIVAAMSLSAAAFAAAPGSTNGKQEGKQTGITAETEIKVESEGGLQVTAPAGTFAETVTEVNLNAEVTATDNTGAAAAAATINAAIAQIAGADANADLVVNTKIDITLTDQDGQAIQPAEGKTVTVTAAYDGASNAVAYVNGDKVEFIKLTVNGTTASFDVTHFSDYYMVKVADSVVASLEGKSANVGAIGNTGDNTDDNKGTGFALAIIPAAVAAAGVVVSKKRK